jgi:RHS repeat-associated protein
MDVVLRDWILPGFALGFSAIVLGFLGAVVFLGGEAAKEVWDARYLVFGAAYLACFGYRIVKIRMRRSNSVDSNDEHEV